MSPLQMLKQNLAAQLFASPAQADLPQFEATRYKINRRRMALLCVCMLLVDFVRLVLYLALDVAQGHTLALYSETLFLKLLFFVACFLYVTSKSAAKYNPRNPLHKNLDILFFVLFAGQELLFFTQSSQTLGPLIRLFAVPLILCSVLVLKRVSATVLCGLLYICSFVYLMLIGTQNYIIRINSLIADVAIFSMLFCWVVACISYSCCANSFAATKKMEEAEQKLLHSQQKLRNINQYDELTGLLNQNGLQTAILQAEQTDSKKRQADTGSAIVIDIDFFSAVNDWFGPTNADVFLVEMVNCIRSVLHNSLPDSDYVFARHGGEEFSVLVYGHPHARVTQMAEAIRKQVFALRIQPPLSTASPLMSVSIGVYTDSPVPALNFTEILVKADSCMLQAKQQGRNCVVAALNNLASAKRITP
ncbi:MAG: GGDEF domain-containing protein [Oscillospiraceae bacterium]